MANEATLESLRIEVNASAQSASAGISTLIGSLRHLATASGTALAPLRQINEELKKMAKFGVIKIPNLAGGRAVNTGAFNAETRAIAERATAIKQSASVIERFKSFTPDQWKAWRASSEAITKSYREHDQEKEAIYGPFSYGPPTSALRSEAYLSRAEWERQADANRSALLAQRVQAASAIQQTTSSASPVASNAITNVAKASSQAEPAVRQVNNAIRETSTVSKNASTGLSQTAQTTSNVSKEVEKATPKVSKFSKSLGSIGRIAKTMLIRTALRSLMKAFGESWQAAYAFSNAMGGSFALSVDRARALLANTTTSIVSAFAPALQAIIPIVNVVASAIQYLCSMLVWLMGLFGLTSDIAGASTEKINKYYGASAGGAGGAAKANKNLLASWDELNIIQSASGGGGGGGGGGGYKPGSLSDMVSAELSAILSIIVGEALLAVGLILACTGHVGIGIGLMAIGAASIGKTLKEDWAKLPTKVQKTIVQIMGYVGYGMLAIGMIIAFACPSHLGIGLGLMALGALNITAAVGVSFGNGISDEVRKTLTEVMLIAGSSLLALGIILLCCQQYPLGIGLILAGVSGLATAYGLNWGEIVDKVNGVMTAISDWFVARWADIKNAVAMAWAVVSKWWKENVSDNVSKAWESVSSFFATLFADSSTAGSIAYYAKTAWDAVVGWWTSNISAPIEEAWNGVTEWFEKDFWGSTEQGGTVVGIAWDAWQAVESFWTENIVEPFSKAWDGVVGYFSKILGDENDPSSIAGSFKKTWEDISYWWGELTSLFSKAWDSVKEYFSGILGDENDPSSIAGFFKTTWNDISYWWGEIKTMFSEKWDELGTYFTELWNGISEPITSAWNTVKQWWEKTGIKDAIDQAWTGVKQFFEDVFAPIHKAWEVLQKITGADVPQNPANVNFGNMLFGNSPSFMTKPLSTWNFGGFHADGAFGIPSGDLFIANERGAELVGSMNSKTTVANQGQIIAGIQAGVAQANSDQNALLRRQNELLIELIEKSGSVTVEPSAAWGKFNQRSSEMWNKATGRG